MALTFDWVDDNSSRDGAGQIVDLEYFEKKSLKRHPNELRLNYEARLQRLENAMGMTEMELKLMEHIIVNDMKLEDYIRASGDDDEWVMPWRGGQIKLAFSIFAGVRQQY